MIVENWDLPITLELALRGRGINKRTPDILRETAWALKEGFPLLAPKVWIREFGVLSLRHEKLILENGMRLSGTLIARHLGDVQRVAVMVCTIGRNLEEVVSSLLAEEPSLAMALEGVGIAAVELLATEACGRMEKQAADEGLYPSIPLSPGMVGWPVNPGQIELFSLVDAKEAGITLDENLVMHPRLSLSQVQGYGETKAISGRTCDYCSLRETCTYQDHYTG